MSSPRPSVVTPGNHDGVHLGHRALVAAARQLAAEHGARVLPMFFDPHPTAFFRPDAAPALLTSPARRIALLRKAGADDVAVETFDEAFANQSPEAFVRDVLVGRYAARGVVVGPDFQFGKGRAGDVEVLRTLGDSLGFSVTVVPPVEVGADVVSSTRIRSVLTQGDVAAATALLGRVHDVRGVVVEGHRRGRTIGFPTANLDCEPVLLPADGVYAVVARVLDGSPVDDSETRLLRGVANLGVRPTMQAGRSVEVHFFDFDADLYGKALRVGFCARLRAEKKFDGLDALKAQIARDADAARTVLATVTSGPKGPLSWI